MNILADSTENWFMNTDAYLYNWEWILLAAVVLIAIIVVVIVAVKTHKANKKAAAQEQADAQEQAAAQAAAAADASAFAASQPAKARVIVNVPKGITAEVTEYILRAGDVFHIADVRYTEDAGLQLKSWALQPSSGPAPVLDKDGGFKVEAGVTYNLIGMAYLSPVKVQEMQDSRIDIEGNKYVDITGPQHYAARHGAIFNVHDIEYHAHDGYEVMVWNVYAGTQDEIIQIHDDGSFRVEGGKTYTLQPIVGAVRYANGPRPDVTVSITQVPGFKSEQETFTLKSGEAFHVKNIAYKLDDGCKLVNWTLHAEGVTPEVTSEGSFVVTEQGKYWIVPNISTPEGMVSAAPAAPAAPASPATAPAATPAAAPAAAPDASKNEKKERATLLIQGIQGVRNIEIPKENSVLNVGDLFCVECIKYDVDDRFVMRGWKLDVNGVTQPETLDLNGVFEVEAGTSYTLTPVVMNAKAAAKADAAAAAAAAKQAAIDKKEAERQAAIDKKAAEKQAAIDAKAAAKQAEIDKKEAAKKAEADKKAAEKQAAIDAKAAAKQAEIDKKEAAKKAEADKKAAEKQAAIDAKAAAKQAEADKKAAEKQAAKDAKAAKKNKNKDKDTEAETAAPAAEPAATEADQVIPASEPETVAEAEPAAVEAAEPTTYETPAAAETADTADKSDDKQAEPVKEEKVAEDNVKDTDVEEVESATTEAEEAAAAKKPANKVYHVSKRKSDGKWQVKFANGVKAIKLFDTQLEAIDFAKKLAISQDARIVIHKEDGTFRKLTYNKKS